MYLWVRPVTLEASPELISSSWWEVCPDSNTRYPGCVNTHRPESLMYGLVSLDMFTLIQRSVFLWEQRHVALRYPEKIARLHIRNILQTHKWRHFSIKIFASNCVTFEWWPVDKWPLKARVIYGYKIAFHLQSPAFYCGLPITNDIYAVRKKKKNFVYECYIFILLCMGTIEVSVATSCYFGMINALSSCVITQTVLMLSAVDYKQLWWRNQVC